MMKAILSIFLFVITSCAFSQKLTVTIYNKTGFDLDSAIFQGKQIGLIKKDGMVTIKNLATLSLQGYMNKDEVPQFDVDAVIANKLKEDYQFGKCGTGITYSSKKKGRFEFDIMYYEYEGKYRLYWQPHEKSKK